MDSQFCWPFPNRRQTEAENEGNFTIFSLSPGVASLRPIHSYKTACSTSRICSMCFAREENAITRKWQNQKHTVHCKRSHLGEWPCCDGVTKTDWKNFTGTQAKVQGLQKGARQLKSRKPLRKTQGQTSFLDRHVRNMENRRGPLNRRIKRYSILQQLNFGDSSLVSWNSLRYPDILESWQDRSKLTRAMANAISTGNWNIKRFRIDRAGVSQAREMRMAVARKAQRSWACNL